MALAEAETELVFCVNVSSDRLTSPNRITLASHCRRTWDGKRCRLDNPPTRSLS